MTETPPSFAGTPDRAAPAAGPDVLSEMLRAVRLTGSVFFGGNFTAPFGVISPKQWDESTPLARLRHISIFHLVASGRCTFEHADGSRREISTGDLLLLPFADEHRFWNGTPPEFAFAPDIVRPGPIEGVATLNYGGGGEETRHDLRLYRSRRNSCSRRCSAPCRRCWSSRPATRRSAR